MTVQPKNHFKCDRCGDEAYTPVENTPLHQRNAPPEGWASLRVGDDPTEPMRHLCPPCAFGLTGYLEGGPVKPS